MRRRSRLGWLINYYARAARKNRTPRFGGVLGHYRVAQLLPPTSVTESDLHFGVGTGHYGMTVRHYTTSPMTTSAKTVALIIAAVSR